MRPRSSSASTSPAGAELPTSHCVFVRPRSRSVARTSSSTSSTSATGKRCRCTVFHDAPAPMQSVYRSVSIRSSPGPSGPNEFGYSATSRSTGRKLPLRDHERPRSHAKRARFPGGTVAGLIDPWRVSEESHASPRAVKSVGSAAANSRSGPWNHRRHQAQSDRHESVGRGPVPVGPGRRPIPG